MQHNLSLSGIVSFSLIIIVVLGDISTRTYSFILLIVQRFPIISFQILLHWPLDRLCSDQSYSLNNTRHQRYADQDNRTTEWLSL